MKQKLKLFFDFLQQILGKKYNRWKVTCIVIFSTLNWIISNDTEILLLALPSGADHIIVYSVIVGIFMGPWIAGIIIALVFHTFLLFKRIKKNFLEVWINCSFIAAFILMTTYIRDIFLQ